MCGGFAGTLKSGGDGRIRIDCIPQVLSIGSYLAVLPPNPPSLQILRVADRVLPANPIGPIDITLSFNAPSDVAVKTRARNFPAGSIPIGIVLTPDSGEPTKYQQNINMDSTGQVDSTFGVLVPRNNPTRLSVWTR